jgi:ATP-binding cassette subfamily C protein LapB
MGTAATIFTRLQQARVARKSLDDLFIKPTDHDPERAMIRREQIKGDYELHQVMVVYPERETIALTVPTLQIKAGERIGVLGKTGAGKSTLLRLLSGLHPAQQGQVLLDGAPLTGLDPIDLRRDVAYMSQQSGLFYGTLRDNITLGQRDLSAQAIDQALYLSGAEALVSSHPQGLDLLLHEGGAGLSGGQRQQLLLARLIARNPCVVLLDEPTAAMDELTERQLIERLTPWLSDKTLVIATHKPQVLRWVNRLLVVDRGKLVMSGPRDAVLAKLSPVANHQQQKVSS